LNKPDQHDCRNDYIYRKKRTNPVSEQFTNKQRNIQAVLQQPRHKLRARKDQSEHTANQVQVSRFHGCISSHAAPKSVEQVHLCPDMIRRMAILRVHVMPNAKSDVVVGEHGGALKIKLRAPAVEGKANAALVHFLAEHLKLPRNAIVLKRGEKSRGKTIEIHGLSKEDVCRRLRSG
jgi:uncharacterized protein